MKRCTVFLACEREYDAPQETYGSGTIQDWRDVRPLRRREAAGAHVGVTAIFARTGAERY